MAYTIHFYSSYCGTSTFTINGQYADYDEFGEKGDDDPHNAPEYGCGFMRFEGIEPKQEILEKYGITMAEYYEIVEKLEEGLSFGYCSWCA